MASPLIGVTAPNKEWAESYVRAVQSTGASAEVLIDITPQQAVEKLGKLDGVLITGGEDVDPRLYGETPHPKTQPANKVRDAFEVAIIQEAVKRDMPLLGICRGMQIMNVALGGKLIQHMDGHHGTDGREEVFHEIFISPGSKLALMIGQGHGGFPLVNSIHHQGLDNARVAKGLRAVAFSPKDGVVEALESTSNAFVIGVQWHPERFDHMPPMNAKFKNLFAALAHYAENKNPQGKI